LYRHCAEYYLLREQVVARGVAEVATAMASHLLLKTFSVKNSIILVWAVG
jgi:hypothetical protein